MLQVGSKEAKRMKHFGSANAVLGILCHRASGQQAMPGARGIPSEDHINEQDPVARDQLSQVRRAALALDTAL